MLAALAAFSIAGLCTGTVFLASYIEENGFPEFPTLRRAALDPAPVVTAPAPVWCERTRRWRHPVTRAFVKAPAGHLGAAAINAPVTRRHDPSAVGSRGLP